MENKKIMLKDLMGNLLLMSKAGSPAYASPSPPLAP